MNTIDAMQAEIEYQVRGLHKLDLSSPIDNCLFVGSGDSYIAGLAAQYFSGSHAICCSPIDIIKNPLLVKRRNLFIVSISGNTHANILAAKIAKKHGASAISALTARASSRLAKSCDQIIELKYKNTGITTAGTIGFTASMIACISLCTELQLPSNLRKMYNRAAKLMTKTIVIAVVQAVITYLAIISFMQFLCMAHLSLTKYLVQKPWPIQPKSFAILHYLVSKRPITQ
jgi:fructoselysine-6-P-deglycase FrlB-like protein